MSKQKEKKYETPDKKPIKPNEKTTGSSAGIDLEFDSDEEKEHPVEQVQQSPSHNIPPLDLTAIHRNNNTHDKYDTYNNGLTILAVDPETRTTFYTLPESPQLAGNLAVHES